MNTYLSSLDTRRSIHCFVLEGTDTVSREHARESIVSALGEILGSPLTREHFDSSAGEFALYVQKMLSPSLFGDLRVFHVQHAQTLSDGDLDELKNVLTFDIPDVYIIIEIDDDKKVATKVLKKLSVEKRSQYPAPTCLHETFAPPRDYATADWLVANTPRLIGRRIAKTDAEYLADRVGYDLDALHSELQKIDLHLEPGEVINRPAIDLITGTLRERTSFELAAAVGRRDFAAALQTIDALFSVKTFMPLMVSALSRHFWSLFRIRKFLSANPAVARTWAASKSRRGPSTEQTEAGMAIGKAAGILSDGHQGRIFPVLIKSGIVEQAAGFSDNDLAQILAWLLEFDAGFKTGKIEANEQTFQLLCYKIIRVRMLTKDEVAA